ncbi:unnamed protein product [Cylicostephanus goldi]|uniref:Uncharacterized protein n=1 Tax=Cylicostephanus goldi TaxID=71465 RepID=A0A3P6QI80_CYLGO|nr:unnamed protein product [Cylicostephanus goldi]
MVINADVEPQRPVLATAVAVMQPNYSTFTNPAMSAGPPDLLDIPGKRATFTSGSEEEIRLGSRVTFNDQSVNIEGIDFQMNEVRRCKSCTVMLVDEERWRLRMCPALRAYFKRFHSQRDLTICQCLQMQHLRNTNA